MPVQESKEGVPTRWLRLPPIREGTRARIADEVSAPNVLGVSRSEAPASLRAERHAALPDFSNQSATGVTPCV